LWLRPYKECYSQLLKTGLSQVLIVIRASFHGNAKEAVCAQRSGASQATHVALLPVQAK
jgi:hypothetical protein